MSRRTSRRALLASVKFLGSSSVLSDYDCECSKYWRTGVGTVVRLVGGAQGRPQLSTLPLDSLGMATLDRERVLFIVALEEPLVARWAVGGIAIDGGIDQFAVHVVAKHKVSVTRRIRNRGVHKLAIRGLTDVGTVRNLRRPHVVVSVTGRRTKGDGGVSVKRRKPHGGHYHSFHHGHWNGENIPYVNFSFAALRDVRTHLNGLLSSDTIAWRSFMKFQSYPMKAVVSAPSVSA